MGTIYKVEGVDAGGGPRIVRGIGVGYKRIILPPLAADDVVFIHRMSGNEVLSVAQIDTFARQGGDQGGALLCDIGLFEQNGDQDDIIAADADILADGGLRFRIDDTVKRYVENDPNDNRYFGFNVSTAPTSATASEIEIYYGIAVDLKNSLVNVIASGSFEP